MPHTRTWPRALPALLAFLAFAPLPGVAWSLEPAPYVGREGHGVVESTRQVADNTSETVVILDDGRVLAIRTVTNPKTGTIVSRQTSFLGAMNTGRGNAQ